jgi:putative flippase GtrA
VLSGRTVLSALQPLLGEMLRFVSVGMLAVLVDVGGFNLIRATGGEELFATPLWAKVWSTSAATLLAWAGHHWWTFRQRRRTDAPREFATFLLVYGASALIALGCLACSHYVLQWRSNVADNISGNIVGLVLGTVFRYWACRRWVFNEYAQRP